MTTIQPQPAPAPAANRTHSRTPEALRLLRVWVELTQRAASAAAHHRGDEESLRNLQLQVEDEITDRIPDSEETMAELVGWEATLIHEGLTPPETCLICRAARSGPPSLPLSTAKEGAL